MDNARIVCLCGSTRFYDDFVKARLVEETNGKVVLGPDTFSQSNIPPGIKEEDLDKELLKLEHLQKINASDEVLVINKGGYIGQSTSEEIEYAQQQGKTVRYMFDKN